MLSDPNQHLTNTEIRLGKGVPTKVLSKQENRDEKILLGDMYTDKEFLRWKWLFEVILWNIENRSVFERSNGDEYLSKLSEEGFLFLTDRSEFWRNHKPIYVTQGERNKIIQSRKASRSSSLSILWDKHWCEDGQETRNVLSHIHVDNIELWINLA